MIDKLKELAEFLQSDEGKESGKAYVEKLR